VLSRRQVVPFAPYASERDKLDRLINSFATQSFRDQADRDYIVARLACRYDLLPQFLWSAQQAVEKYLKAILLYNRVKAPHIKHDLTKALSLASSLSTINIDLSPRSRAFIDHLARYAQYRYIDVPFFVEGHILVDLDLTVWEVRRYCQVLNVFGKVLPPKEKAQLDQARAAIDRSRDEPRYKFRLHGGLLEQMLSRSSHPSRPALLWQNSCFGVRKRSTVRAKDHLSAQDPLLSLYPELLDELLEYVFLPKTLVDHYRALPASKRVGSEARP
jgi:HEPN domain-containing protein